MKHRHTALLWALALIILVGSSLDLSAQFRRRDIYDPFYSAADRHRLRQLMIQWLTIHPFTNPANPIQQHRDVVAPLPVGVHCKTGTFATWHRQYIDQLETWLMGQQDGPKFVPLPKWDPTTQIPPEFYNGLVPPGNAVVTTYPQLTNQNPSGYNFNRFTNPATICNYTPGTFQRYCMTLSGNQFFTSFGTAFDNFARDLELEHNPVHGSIGGVMNNASSPAATIFWLWHAYVDDLYQHYLCACTNDYPDKDLHIKDNDGDIGGEPNTTTTIYYLSPEIWVRQNADVFNAVTGRYSLEDNPNRHQNAEYKAAGNNYVYVRVRNKGCQATVAQEVRLRVYWSKAQTAGWSWPGDWTNTPPQIPKRGDEITNPGVPLYVPPLQPGHTWVAEVPWQAPNPADYPNDSYHFCLLGRLESISDPMTFPEGTDVNANTRNNNNIAWKNVSVLDNDPFNIVPPTKIPWHTVHVRPTPGKAVYKLRVRFGYPDNHGVYATIDLRGNLYDKWDKAGRPGYGVTYVSGTYVRIDKPGAYIEVPPAQDDIYTLGVQPYVQYTRGYAGVIQNYGERLNFNVTQEESYDRGVTYEVAGGNNYEIRFKQSPETTCDGLIKGVSITHASCPSSANGAIAITSDTENEYFWSNGHQGATLLNVAPGTYWVVVRNAKKCVERREIVVGNNSRLATAIASTIPRCRAANGDATVTVTGGRTPYTYQWYQDGTPINGATNAKLANMGFGSYRVEVTDANGCQITDAMNFTDDFMQMSLAFNVVGTSSDDAVDGSTDLVVINGMAPFTYQWSNGKTTEDLSDIPRGTYSVTVTDHMGCTATGSVVVDVRNSGNLKSVESPQADLSVLSLVPNPTTDLAEVQYTLRYISNVRVEIYDELGKRVASYDQGSKMPGVNSAWLDTRSLPSGRYACRLVYNGGVSAIPFVVIR